MSQYARRSGSSATDATRRPAVVARLGRELVHRVERQELHTVDPVQLGAADAGVHRVDGAVRSIVAVGDRFAEKGAVRIEQSVVDAPRVDTDRLDVWITGGEGRETGEDLLVEAGHVPAQMPIVLVYGVRKAVHHVERQRVAGDDACDDASTRRAEVDGCEDPLRHAHGLAEEGGGHAGVDRYEEPGGVAEFVGRDGGDAVRDVFRAGPRV